MYAVVVIRITDPAGMEAVRQPHLDWLAKNVAGGTIMVSGRQTQGAGGIVFATAPSRGELDAILKEDAYLKAGVATHEVIEFEARHGTLLDALKASSAH